MPRQLAPVLGAAITALAFLAPQTSSATALGAGQGVLRPMAAEDLVPIQYYGPGSGTGMGRAFGPGSGTGMGRCRPVRVRVCRGGFGDGRGPRCYITQQIRCERRF